MPDDLGKLLRYGKWSGPGYTAGLTDAALKERDFARILAPQDRVVPGIDAYDNFVAKAHDLNEFDAEEHLRRVLIDLGLASGEQAPFQGRNVYRGRLRYGGDTRFVKYTYYSSKFRNLNASDVQAERFAKSFILYYSHVVKSNCQFSVDHVKNLPTLTNRGAIRMLLQLGFAAHVFLGEATKVERIIDGIIDEFGPKVYDSRLIDEYLRAHFITPEGVDFARPAGGGSFRRSLRRDEILSMDRRRLTEVYVRLRDDME